MSFLGQELKKIISMSRYKDESAFLGSLCYLRVGDYVRMRVEFEGDGGLYYDGLKMTMINYREGEVDSIGLGFGEVLGMKGRDNPIFRGGFVPRIWNDEGCLEWYIYKPDQPDYQKLAERIDSYADIYQEHGMNQGPRYT